MAVKISDNNLAQLQLIAKMAYGSGRTEKTSGGNGYIGQVGGKVVKFATHSKERSSDVFAVTDDIERSCNDLRRSLAKIAKESFDENDAVSRGRLSKLYASLGLTGDGALDENLVGKKSLLTRKVVAKALNAIADEANRSGGGQVDVWSGARAATVVDRRALSQEDTSFATVGGMARANAALGRLADFKTPLDRFLENMSANPKGNGGLCGDDVKILREGLQEARRTLVESVRVPLEKLATNHGVFGPSALSREDAQAARADIEKAAVKFGEAALRVFKRIFKDPEDELRTAIFDFSKREVDDIRERQEKGEDVDATTLVGPEEPVGVELDYLTCINRQLDSAIREAEDVPAINR